MRLLNVQMEEYKNSYRCTDLGLYDVLEPVNLHITEKGVECGQLGPMFTLPHGSSQEIIKRFALRVDAAILDLDRATTAELDASPAKKEMRDRLQKHFRIKNESQESGEECTVAAEGTVEALYDDDPQHPIYEIRWSSPSSKSGVEMLMPESGIHLYRAGIKAGDTFAAKLQLGDNYQTHAMDPKSIKRA